MIKIIKEGTRQTKECDECGCVFSFDKEDVEKNIDYNSLYLNNKSIIRCPQCETVLELGHQ